MSTRTITLTFTFDASSMVAVNAFAKQNLTLLDDTARPYDTPPTDGEIEDFIRSAVDNSIENYLDQASEIEDAYFRRAY
jgi:hypothetical protein